MIVPIGSRSAVPVWSRPMSRISESQENASERVADRATFSAATAASPGLGPSQGSRAAGLGPLGRWIGSRLLLDLLAPPQTGPRSTAAISQTPWLLAGMPVDEPVVGPRFGTQERVPASQEEARQAIEARDGMMVKADQYPGIEWLGNSPPGTKSYRHMGRYQTTGQPSVQGLREMMKDRQQEYHWVNVREEPVVYIQGMPYNMRVDAMKNESVAGSSPEEVARQEKAWADRLKAEIEAPPQGYILLHEEVKLDDGREETRPVYVRVCPEDIQTPTEVVEKLQGEGFKLHYHRVPVTDESAPEPEDFDALVEVHQQCSADSQFIINCHGGRGRTTTALTVLRLLDELGLKSDSPAWKALQKWAGELRMEELVSLVGGLARGQIQVDALIEHVGKDPQTGKELIHLRQCIQDSLNSSDPEHRKLAPQFAERLARLLLFAAYLNQQPEQKLTFEAWMAKHPELQEVMTGQQLKQAGSNP